MECGKQDCGVGEAELWCVESGTVVCERRDCGVWKVGGTTISLDSHQNIRLHTGAHANVVLLT